MPWGWERHNRAGKDVGALRKKWQEPFRLRPARRRGQLLLAGAQNSSYACRRADGTVSDPQLDRASSSRDVYADRGYPTTIQEAKQSKRLACMRSERRLRDPYRRQYILFLLHSPLLSEG